jgi:multiple sugar transport system permease protein
MLVGLLFVLPFVWMVATSVKPPADLYSLTPSFVPSYFRWSNYSDILEFIPFARFYLNTIIVTAVRVVAQIFLCSLAAFAFARLRFPGRNLIFILFLTALMVPPQMTVIPNFVIIRYLGWLDTYAGLIVPSIFSAFGIFLLRQFFLTLPGEFQEAATLEGANPFQIYLHIFLPLARTAIAAFALIQILWSWHDFLWPLIVTRTTNMQVLSVGLALLEQDMSLNRALVMAAATLATIPLIAAFLLLQKQLVEGIALSGVK